MKNRIVSAIGLVGLLWTISSSAPVIPEAKPMGYGSTRAKAAKAKIVVIAGVKSHGEGEHEYWKTARLLKTMLDKSNGDKVSTAIYDKGWPPNAEALEDAQLIVFITDGHDDTLFPPAPFATTERLRVLEKQVRRGCGLAFFHFSMFTDDSVGARMLDWVGGYFDWQGDDGKREWYSALQIADAEVDPAAQKSPINNGVAPFRIKEEFYYNLRFKPDDKRLVPVAVVPALNGRAPFGNVVAWAVERTDGGRGFCTTMGHYYTNWNNADYRKLLLNGLVWAAGLTVPADGVQAPFYTDQEVDKYLKNTK